MLLSCQQGMIPTEGSHDIHVGQLEVRQDHPALLMMSKVSVQFLGSGDAFGSGGRLQTCIYVDCGSVRFLLDCGATSMSALKHWRVSPNSIEAILLTHLHGDHFGGLPFFILDAQLVSRRTRPLSLAGPAGTEQRIQAAQEVLFPGSSQV